MANLWVTGDSWGVLDKEFPHSHWINYYKQHYKLKNIYCLARQSIAQDMINYMTSCVVKNIQWPGRKEKWQNYDDHLIVFPTTPTRITFNMIWDKDRFDPQHGPHNLNWDSATTTQVQQHPWYTDNKTANLDSENFTSMATCDNDNKQFIEAYGAVHPMKFTDWRDTNHLDHIVREVQTCKIYGRGNFPAYGSLFKDEELNPKVREHVNHLDVKRHYKYWKAIRKNL